MERRIEHLEERLRALRGALRLRGVGGTAVLPAGECPGPSPSPAVPRLRRAVRDGG